MGWQDDAVVSGSGWQGDEVVSKPDKPKVTAGDRAQAAVSGTNMSIAGLLGMPMDTVQNLYNLGKAGIGTAAGLAGRSDLMPELTTNTPLSSEWIADKLNRIGQETRLATPQDSMSRMLYRGANVLGGAALGGRPSALLPAAAGAAVAGEVSSNPLAPALGAMVPGAVAQVGREASAAGRNAVTSRVNQQFETPYAKQGLESEQATGMQLGPGAITGNAALSMAENAARQSLFTRNKVLEGDQKTAVKAIEHVNELADRASVNRYSSAEMGENLQSALKGTVQRIDELRDKSAALDYGAVRKAAGDKPVIAYKNTAAELEKIRSEYANVAGADAEKIAAQATRMLERVTQEAPRIIPERASIKDFGKLSAPPEIGPKTVTVDEAMRTRRYYSKAAAGTGNIFEDIAPNLNRNLASRMARAADADFEQANGAGPVYDLLKQANRNYADHSKSIEYVQTSVLGKLLGKEVADAALTGAVGNTVAGETVTARMLKMEPSQAKTVSNILAQHAPNVLNDAKAYVLRDALNKGMDIPTSAGAKAIPMSYAKFIKSLPSDEYLMAMRFSPKEIGDIKSTVDAMRRAGDRTGYNTSGTAPMGEIYAALRAVAGLSVRGTVSIAGSALGLNKIANAMTSQEGRSALRTAVTPGTSDAQLTQALAVIAATP